MAPLGEFQIVYVYWQSYDFIRSYFSFICNHMLFQMVSNFEI